MSDSRLCNTRSELPEPDELTAHLVAVHGLPLSHVEVWGHFGRAYNHQLDHEVLKQEHTHA